jgi:tetratricopeptide (TPR) repeat protein
VHRAATSILLLNFNGLNHKFWRPGNFSRRPSHASVGTKPRPPTIDRHTSRGELLSVGDALSQLGDYAAAIERYGEAVAAAPEQAAGYIRRADDLVKTGTLDAALTDYGAALRIAPNDAAIYLKRMSVYLFRE